MSEFQVPVFPLPDVVFFPETVLPLHVFEPRYRRMMADCLAGERRLAVAKLCPGWEKDYEGRPPIHEVVGVGEVLQAQTLADGRFNVLLDGRLRVRIVAEERPDGLPYRRARVRPLATVEPVPGDPGLAERLQALRGAHEKLLAALGQGHADVVGRLTVAGSPPGAVIDRIVSAVVPDAAIRQKVLETLDVGERLEIAAGALSDLLAFVAGPHAEDEPEEG